MRTNRLSFGIHVDSDLRKCSIPELKDIVDLCKTSRLVVLKNQHLSVERFAEINAVWGRHIPKKIWSSHPDFPQIIKITDKEVYPGVKGFLHTQQSVDWHSDWGAFSLISAPDVTVLWCIESGIGGATHFSCGVQAYTNLNQCTREEIADAQLFMTLDSRKTLLKKAFYENYMPQFFDKTGKLKPYMSDREKAGKGQGKSLVIRHKFSKEIGLYFPYCSVKKITGLKKPEKERVIFNELITAYVGKKGLFYKHNWQPGDMVLMDQSHTLHKRDSYEGIREVYRTSFYYH